MRYTELLTESPTDNVARHYKEASATTDLKYNTAAVNYSNLTGRYYDAFFKDFKEGGAVPVFEKPVMDDKSVEPFSNKLEYGEIQSPGHRGLQVLRALAGLSYDRNIVAPDKDIQPKLEPKREPKKFTS